MTEDKIICDCDRAMVCTILGDCFLEHEQVQQMPKYMQKQIKNARSPLQALQIFKTKHHLNAHKKKVQG